MELSLIANTGIQFYIHETDLGLDSPLVMPDGKVMRSMVFHEYKDWIKEQNLLEFAYYFPSHKCYVGYSDLKSAGFIQVNEKGEELLDELGLPAPWDENDIDFDIILPLDQKDCYGEQLLNGSVRIQKEGQLKSMFELLEGEWLPMPMFEMDSIGTSVFGPSAWCRLKICEIGPGKTRNLHRYRLIWAFDTSISNYPSDRNPFFYLGVDEKTYGLCNSSALLMNFLSNEPYSCGWVDEYLAKLIHGGKEHTVLKNANGESSCFRYLAYYIYFVNYLRMADVSPRVRLFSGQKTKLGVDLVLDIGNSRTCGVLFENSDFTLAEKLQLRDLSNPEKVYADPFDMRLAFHRSDFGEMDVDDVFEWKSYLRIGEEASKLIYQSKQPDGLSESTTNYSSPKRYLWDNTEYAGQWEFLVTEQEEVPAHKMIYIKGLSEQFNSDGSLLTEGSGGVFSSFSRRSLMTFVMIEIIQQARSQINSLEFRQKHGNIDQLRYLNHIIITCPTAMSEEEQVILRQCAEDAYVALLRCGDKHLYFDTYKRDDWKDRISIVPSVDGLRELHSCMTGMPNTVDWSYDEASCCQLVYLYAEVAERYQGNAANLIEQKGHVREEFLEDGYEKKSLTIGSIDIGAGTTDLMICAYQQNENLGAGLCPVPIFWDSFYFAGDDMLQEIIRTLLIEGTDKKRYIRGYGSIYNAVCAENIYREYGDSLNEAIADLEHCSKEDSLRIQRISVISSNKLHDFFDKDHATMTFMDRRMRNEFNVQIAIPFGNKMLELLRDGKSRCELKFGDLFDRMRPSSYLLEYFASHFGIRFEELTWYFDPLQISEIVISRIEPLMRQLSVVLSSYDCDIVLLAGRPTSLTTVTDLFLKLYPVSPDRLIRLNDYRVGNWYPFATGQGFFYDPKTIVAVGAMIGFLASQGNLNSFSLDMSQMRKRMRSTAKYIGFYDVNAQQVNKPLLTPEMNSVTFMVNAFPAYLGCRQLRSPYYQAHPLYAITVTSEALKNTELRITVMRNYMQDREKLEILSITDKNGTQLSQEDVRIRIQSLADGYSYWLDKGEFILKV